MSKYTVQVQFDTLEEVQAVLARLDVDAVAVEAEPDTSGADEAAAEKEAARQAQSKRNKAAAAKRRADKEAKEKAEAEVKDDGESGDENDEENDGENADDILDDDATGGGFSREQVKARLKEYAAIEGREAVIALLKKHGAEAMSQLAEDKFAAVMKEAKV